MFEEFEEDHNDIGEGGGVLAAQLSPAVRMDMVSRGYNPMSPADVSRYQNKQRPVEGLMELAGVNLYKSIGNGGGVDARDIGLVSDDLKQFDDFAGIGARNNNIDPRSAVNSKMDNSYNNRPRDLNAALTSRIGQQESNKRTIALPKQQQIQSKKVLITEAKQAKTIGYKFGVNYLNAFVDLVQNPSTQSRAVFIEAINKTILAEDKMHPQVLKEYRFGLAYAEKEMYNKIRSNKKA